MAKRMISVLVMSVALLGISGTAFFVGLDKAEAKQWQYPTLSYGSKGDYVWDLQYRLKVMGFYNQSMDGRFGYSTLQAVKRYQKQYGLNPDGVAGASTWTSLRKFTINAAEADLMARLVYGEARGESFEGQVAVAAVVMNRVRSSKFPNTVAEVIYQPGAFTAVSDGQIYLRPNAEAYDAVFSAVKGWDPTNGALYYFNPRTSTSAWIWNRPQAVTIGQHIFAY